jgi:hypothetical protein
MPFQDVSKVYIKTPPLYIFQLFRTSLAAVNNVFPSSLKPIDVMGVAIISVELA